MVSAESMLKPAIIEQKPRKAFLFQKADWATLKLKIKKFQEPFLMDSLGKSVEELLNDFTTTLNKLCGEYIPSSLPWVTQEIKRLIRKRAYIPNIKIK